MPKSESQCEKIKKERKSNILGAALQLFSMRGYDAVKMNDIADMCSCSHGLIYHYYNSKEDIFHDLMELSHKEVSTFHLFNIEENVKPDEQLLFFMSRIVTMLKGNIKDCYYFYMLTNMRFQKTLPPPPEICHKKQPVSMRKYLQELIEEGQKDGTIYEGNSQEMALLFHSLLRGIFFEKLNTPENEYIVPTVETMSHLLIKK